MEIKLNDLEIRKILAKAISKEFDYTFTPDPEECWFEVSAGTIDGDEAADIHDVKFCYRLEEGIENV